MRYDTKFDIKQTVCLKDNDGGVKRGTIIGLHIKAGWYGAEKDPDDYQLKAIMASADSIEYVIRVEQPAYKKTNPPTVKVGQDRVATTFEEAWALP
jgi:hypothetical protein